MWKRLPGKGKENYAVGDVFRISCPADGKTVKDLYKSTDINNKILGGKGVVFFALYCTEANIGAVRDHCLALWPFLFQMITREEVLAYKSGRNIIDGKWGMNMPLKNRERIRDEKINGKIFDMSPALSYQHSVINGRLFSKISNGLKNSMCLVFMENIDYKYSKENDDYLEPDIIICCDRNQIRGNSYYGTPKFVAEIISPSTVKRDRGIKKDIYETSGVEEYWIVSPIERAVEIYYLRDGKYKLEESYILDADEASEHYNLHQKITLRAFPVTMTLEEIFVF